MSKISLFCSIDVGRVYLVKFQDDCIDDVNSLETWLRFTVQATNCMICDVILRDEYNNESKMCRIDNENNIQVRKKKLVKHLKTSGGRSGLRDFF